MRRRADVATSDSLLRSERVCLALHAFTSSIGSTACESNSYSLTSVSSSRVLVQSVARMRARNRSSTP